MKPSEEIVTSLSSSLKSAKFKADDSNLPFIFGTLRKGLYTDKVLAVLREYSSNAWDAHRMIGTPDRPIEVHVPTYDDPVFTVRDFGPGLSQDDVFNVYSSYGASTKRATNNAVGMLGLGCLLAGQPIVTINGIKKIEDIVVGDLVLTHKGRFRRVTSLMRRPYKGTAHRVWMSQAQTPLTLTEEHPILVSDANGNQQWLRPSDIETGYRSQKKGIKAWNSYATLPAAVETTTEVLDVATFLDDSYSFSAGVLTKNTEFLNTRDGVPHKTTTTRTTSWNFPETLALDEELGWLLGLFAAEGSTTDKDCVVSLNINEAVLADRFEAGMLAKFGVTFKRYNRPDKSIMELVVGHMPLAAVLGGLVGKGSHNKRVPAVVMTGTQAVRIGFLRGVFDGDGSSTRSRFVFGVASPELAWGVRTLMMMTEDKWGSVGYMPEYERWSISYNREASWSYSYRQGDYLLRPIESIETFELDSEVFNFSVEEDESYVSDFILHNCKSGFAYGDCFTITSWHGGIKSTYSAFIDVTKLGQIDLLSEEISDQESGVEISIVARRDDVDDFENKASMLFEHFVPRPIINIDLPEIPAEQTVLKNGAITGKRKYNSEWIAIMGCVPYRVNLAQLDQTKISKCLPKLSGSLFFSIGDVEIAHSREELEYGAKTKATLVQKLNDLVDEYVVHALADLEQNSVSSWDKRLKAQVLRQLDLPIPAEYEELAEGHVKLIYAPGTISVTSNESAVTNIAVNDYVRLLVDDTGKALKGYQLRQHDYVVRGLGNISLADTQKLLDKALADSGITGIKVELLSTLQWCAPYVKPPKFVNPKHKAKMFTLKAERSRHASPYSDSWDLVDRVPEDTDVYVIISGFVAEGHSDFFGDYLDDKALAEAIGETMPVIYGYKTSDKKPAKVDKGREYKVWRAEWIKSILTPERINGMQAYFWKEPLSSYYGYWPSPMRRNDMVAALGENHLISQLFIKQAAEVPAWAQMLVQRTQTSKVDSDAYKAWKALFERYPLLTRDSIRGLWGSSGYDDSDPQRSKHWYEYIKLIDARDAALPNGTIDVQTLDTEHWSG